MPQVCNQMMACNTVEVSDKILAKCPCSSQVSYAKFISGNNEIQIGSLLPSPLGSYPNKSSPDLF